MVTTSNRASQGSQYLPGSPTYWSWPGTVEADTKTPRFDWARFLGGVLAGLMLGPQLLALGYPWLAATAIGLGWSADAQR